MLEPGRGSYNESHRPAWNGMRPPAAALRACTVTAGEPEDGLDFTTVIDFDVACPDAGRFAIRLRMHESGEHRIAVTLPSGKVIEDAGACYRGWSLDVRAADLNADGTPDAVITFPSNGNGLGADSMSLGFLLSSPEGHVLRTIGAWAPYADDFVTLPGSDRPQFVHTTFVFGEPGRDGKTHNYWVYNLLELHGTEIVLANGRDPQFPLWILYSWKPNHSPTHQLTDEQKRRLLAEQGIDLLTH